MSHHDENFGHTCRSMIKDHIVLIFIENIDRMTCSENIFSGSGECMEKVDMLEMRQHSGSQII